MNFLRIRFPGQQGFSIIEALIAAGLLGGLGVAGMKIMENMMKGQTTSEAKFESMEMKRIVSNVLMDKDACSKTFDGIKIGDSFSAIKSSQNTIMFETDKVYANTIKIRGMKTEDDGAVSSTYRRINLLIDIEVTKKMSLSKGKGIKIPLMVRAAASNALITACNMDTDMILKLACESVGGIWNSVKCDLPSCPSGQVLQAINSSGSAICRSTSCPAGNYFEGLDTNGLAICRNPSCPSGKQLQGLDNTGNPVCVFPLAGKSCSTPGMVVKGFDANGEPVCGPSLTDKACPVGESLTGFASDGSLQCAPAAAGPGTAAGAVHCQGKFTACSATCGNGTRSFTVTQAAQNGGSSCAYNNGMTEACNNGPCTVCDATNTGATRVESGQFEYCNGTAWVQFALDIVMVNNFSNSDNTSSVSVSCPAGYKRISCAGSREKNLGDYCDEQDCGIVGVMPTPNESCQIVIDASDDGPGTKPSVTATCVKI